MLALTWLQKANTITEIIKTFTIFVLENALRNTKAIKNLIAYPVTNLKLKGKEYWPQLEAKNFTTFAIKNAWMLTQSKLERSQTQVRNQSLHFITYVSVIHVPVPSILPVHSK